MIKVTVKRPNILGRAFLFIWGIITFSGRIVGFATYWRTVLIRDERWDDRRLLAHELTHVEQMSKLGIIKYTWRYTIEFFKNGYRNNKYEVEARENAQFRAEETIKRFKIRYK